MSESTPGPWEYDNSRTNFAPHTIRRNGIVIAHVAEARGTQFNGFEATPEVTAANAALIASAPTLADTVTRLAGELAELQEAAATYADHVEPFVNHSAHGGGDCERLTNLRALLRPQPVKAGG